MKKAGVFLAEGFEEIEGLTVVDILRRAEVKVSMIGISDSVKVTGAHGISVETDMLLSETDGEEFDMLVLPGGMPGTKKLGACDRLLEILRKADEDRKGIAAICAAPSVLGDMGLLTGKKAVCYPGFEERLTGAEVLYDAFVTDGHITTSRGMGTAIPFALELTARLCGKETADRIGKSILAGCEDNFRKKL